MFLPICHTSVNCVCTISSRFNLAKSCAEKPKRPAIKRVRTISVINNRFFCKHFLVIQNAEKFVLGLVKK